MPKSVRARARRLPGVLALRARGPGPTVRAVGKVLMISKAVVPPWNDSSKNLVRDLASSMRRHVPVVMQMRGRAHALGAAESAPVYAEASRFAPGLAAQARVLARMLASRNEPIFHFFFAPNPRSSTVGRVASALRGRRTVHTVCSAPREGVDLASVLFADRTVVLSESTERRFLAAGIPRERVVRIPPAVPPLEPITRARRDEVRAELGVPASSTFLLYAGDLEVGGGAHRVVEAALAIDRPDVVLGMACRRKTAAAEGEERALRQRIAAAGLEDRFRWIGETSAILDVVAASDALLLPSTDLFAKMDYPLVVLEAMALGRPCVVADGTPAAELAALGGVLAVPAGADDLAAAMRRLVDDPASREGIGAKGREAALRRFSPPAMAEAYESLYDRLS